MIVFVVLMALSSSEAHNTDELPDLDLWDMNGSFLSDLDNTYPTLVLHGINDECGTWTVHKAERLVQRFVKDDTTGRSPAIECIDPGPHWPKLTSIFTSMEEQAEEYCKLVQTHPVFGHSNFNILGFS